MKFLICMPTGKDGIQDDAVIRNGPRDEFSRMGKHKNLRCHTVFGGFRLFMWFFLGEKLCFGANPVQAKYYRNLFLFMGFTDPSNMR